MPADCTVEVDLYSGRPNPAFVLSAPACASLAERLQALTQVPAVIPSEPLGYRGLSLRLPTGASVRVGFGHVWSGAIVLSDPARGLERWLLEEAGGQLDPALVADLRLLVGRD